MTRSAAATVRWPGDRIAPTSNTLGFAPGPVLEQRGEGDENGYNGVRQGKHWLT